MSIAGKIADKIINNHHMLIENRLCSRFRTSKSDCSECARLCPTQAIQVSDKGAKIAGGCTDCGVCISVCPNGVFRIEGRDDKNIINEIRSRLKEQESKVFHISCEHGDTTSDVILPCLGRLTEVMLLEPFRAGASRIEILQPECRECPNVKAFPHIEKVINRTLNLYGIVGLNKGSLSVMSSGFTLNQLEDISHSEEIKKLPPQTPELKTFSRRKLFGLVKQRTMEAAAEALPELESKGEKKEEAFRDALSQRPENIKRSLLIQSLKEIGAGSAGQGSVVSISSKDAIMTDVEVNFKCTGCGVCAILCPTGAIIQKITEDRFYLYFSPDLCTNCEVCVKTCMPHAVNIKEKVLLNLILEQGERRIFEAGKKKCLVCQLDFIGSSNNICPLCINRHKKQMATIQNWIEKSKPESV